LGHIEGRGAYGITALMRAVRGDNATVQQLIALGVDVNARSGRFFKTTALSEAITWDNLTAVKWLLAAKADVSQGGLLDELPIAAAARLGRQEMVKPLVAAKANVNSRGENQETPLHVASEHAHVATVAALLNQRADAQATTSSGETAIHKVVMGHYPVAGGCRVVVLRQLAAAGVPLEVRHGQYRFTALMEATFSGQTDLFLELQALGADLSVRNIAGASLLMIALWRNHLSTAHAILTARPDVHARARNGETALMIAAGAGHQTIVERLLEARAEVDAENDYGWTAWMVAYENGHRAVAQRLQKAGAIARFDDVREPTLWENATQWVGSCVACALRMARR
jgi:ankyrin repeat protein